MTKKLIKADDLHAKWMKTKPDYAEAYDGLEAEFALASSMIAARADAGLTQEQLAERMDTTRTAIARLESGRQMPSTRTLERLAAATGHRLRISFERIGKGKSPARRTA
jgi:ribosome-binding protein aMBF1 (putative translation factor)